MISLYKQVGIGNTLEVELTSTPQVFPSQQGDPNRMGPDASVRVETDAWGWDWSPALEPMVSGI